LHLRTAFFEVHLLSLLKKLQVCSLKIYKVLMETPNTIVTPYLFGPNAGASSTVSSRELQYPPGKLTLSPPKLETDSTKDDINGIEG